MEFPNKFNQLSTPPDLVQTLDEVASETSYQINCMKVGIVQAFYPDDLTVDVQIAHKKDLGFNVDGTQNVRDYAIIRAKVVYCNPFETFPIKQGDECIIIFSDRELESWFINGEVNPLGYPRMHHLTDAVAIFGIRSLPKMIQILTDALHLFYGGSEIQLKDTEINENTTTYNLNTTSGVNITAPAINITGSTVQTGDITATNLSATAAATGVFGTVDGKTVTVTNGIITAIA